MRITILTLAAAFSTLCLFSQEFKATADLKKYEGYFDFYYSEDKDQILLKVDRLGEEFLYVNSLSQGIGSNDIGLDRGQLGNTRVVYFRRAGNKLLLIQPNLTYRAGTDNALEKASVDQAFARSVLYGFPIKESSDSSHLIDLTPFLMQDAHGVSQRLKEKKQGSYSLDKSRSSIALERTRGFPMNSEFDVLLTFKGRATGSEIRSVTPSPSAVSVHQHHSFIELPDAGYQSRVFDPRSGCYPFDYYDYASPVEEPLLKRFIRRHRLQKKDPNAVISEAVEPIVYYLDNGTPEPVKSALLEGGRWWNQAFEAIGYKDAFQLRMLPDDADPLDIRYNVIQWVHRSTRGWSYGMSVTDPRTGEIIKGHVSLGSLRIRQDFMIAQALMNRPYAERDDNHGPMLELALARIRQLSAHEIGHTLGFTHNFAASTVGRSSVMDYPHPRIRLTDGEIDLSGAYDTDIGEWDRITVAYAYSDFPDGTDEEAALEGILKSAWDSGLRFVSDSDARAPGGAHLHAHLWDNGSDPVTELRQVLAVREKGVSQFSEYNLPSGRSSSELEDVFVPLYFFHRYQTEAATKLIGGLDYRYTLTGDGQKGVERVDLETQLKALSAVLATLDPAVLVIPEKQRRLFGPRTFGSARSRESFPSRMGVAFDPLAAAETAAEFTLSYLLHPERANRLIEQEAEVPSLYGLDTVLEALVEHSMDERVNDSYRKEIQKLVRYRVLDHMMRLGAQSDVYPQVREQVFQVLTDWQEKLARQKKDPGARRMGSLISRYLKDPGKYTPDSRAARIPDGSPIGSACGEYPLPGLRR